MVLHARPWSRQRAQHEGAVAGAATRSLPTQDHQLAVRHIAATLQYKPCQHSSSAVMQAQQPCLTATLQGHLR